MMTMRSFVLPPSCWQGWAGPSWEPRAAKGHASLTLAAHAASAGSVDDGPQSERTLRQSKGGTMSAFNIILRL